MAATTEGQVIPFEPKDQDVLSTKLRSWNLKHPGTLAYGKLIDDFVHELPAGDAADHDNRLSKLVHRIIEIISIERGGRFLKLDPAETRQNHCIVMNRQAIFMKVKFGLANRQKRLQANGTQIQPKPSEITLPPPQQQAHFYTYPCYVSNQQMPKREIEASVKSLIDAKQCNCGNSWCCLGRPRSFFAANPATEQHLVDTIVAYHCQEQWARYSSLSQWFDEADQYRLVISAQGDTHTIQICKSSLCLLLGLSEAGQEAVDRAQQILVFMKRQLQLAIQEGRTRSSQSVQQRYQDFISQAMASNKDHSTCVGLEYFRRFWDCSLRNIQAGLGCDPNRKSSLMTNSTASEAAPTKRRRKSTIPAKYQESANQKLTTERQPSARPTKRLRTGKETTAAQKKKKKAQANPYARTYNSAKKPSANKDATAALQPMAPVPQNNPDDDSNLRLGAQKPNQLTVRRVSMDGLIENATPTCKAHLHWRCSNCFHENQDPPLLVTSPLQRPSIASLDRKHRVQQRKARFIRRSTSIKVHSSLS